MRTHWKNTTPPKPPYFAIIFISQKGDELEGYEEMDEYLMKTAQDQEGFLGYSSVSKEDAGIFISYWKDEESIASWREDSTHKIAKDKAKKGWYRYFHSLICEVKSSQTFEAQWDAHKI